MKNSYLLSVILAIGVCGVCGGLRADPMPVVVAQILAANPDVSVFALDYTRSPGDKVREPEAKRQEKFGAFLERERAGSRPVPDAQKKRLAAILVDPQNYYTGLFSTIDPPTLGIDMKVAWDNVTLCCGHEVISTYYHGEQTNSMLNDKGIAALKQWRDELAAADKAKAAAPMPGGKVTPADKGAR